MNTRITDRVEYERHFDRCFGCRLRGHCSKPLGECIRADFRVPIAVKHGDRRVNRRGRQVAILMGLLIVAWTVLACVAYGLYCLGTILWASTVQLFRATDPESTVCSLCFASVGGVTALCAAYLFGDWLYRWWGKGLKAKRAEWKW